MTKSRNLIRPRKVWTAKDLRTLRRMYPDSAAIEIAKKLGTTVPVVYGRAHKLGLKKSEEFWRGPKSGRLEGTRGASSRFPPGHVPANKGLRRPGWAPGRMAKTQFKRGEMSGAAARKWVPIGTEVRDPDGYLKRKVRDDAPPNMSRKNWEFVHVLLWEQHNGPRPEGHSIVFRDGNRSNITIGNLQLITRRELMARNTVHNLPKELAQVVQLKGALQRQINKRERRREKQDRGSKESSVRNA